MNPDAMHQMGDADGYEAGYHLADSHQKKEKDLVKHACMCSFCFIFYLLFYFLFLSFPFISPIDFKGPQM